MAKSDAKEQTSEESNGGGDRSLKKIKSRVAAARSYVNCKHVRLMFEDEAGFGRINKPKYCWCKKGVRPSVPCHHIREYRYAYGAVEPLTGEAFFLVLPFSDTICMNVFLDHLSEAYPEDYILLVCDGAAWHKSHELHRHNNIELIFIPPGTPEMNPIEQIWKEMRLRGFRNEIFQSLDQVVKRLCNTMNSLTSDTVKSITGRKWILSCFN